MEFILITIQDQIPAMTGFNIGCIDEIDTFKLDNISINDGKNHPLDKKNKNA